MKIVRCSRAKGRSKITPEEDPDLDKEYKKDVCPSYIPEDPKKNIRVCPEKIEEKNRN